MQSFKIGSRMQNIGCRLKQLDGYKRGKKQSSVFKKGLQTELNKDLSIKFNGIIQDTGHVDNNENCSLLVFFLFRQRERCSILAY